MPRIGLALATTLILAPALGAQGPACTGPVARYVVSRVGPDAFAVEADITAPVSRLVLGFSEAEGRPEAQAASVEALEGWADGRPVKVTYAGEGTWSAPAPLTRLRYRLRADHDAVAWGGGGRDEVAAHFGDAYFFVGNAFFLAGEGWPDCPAEVRFDLPEGWRALAPWPTGGGVARASTPATLWKNAFVMGQFTPDSARAGGMLLEWVIDPALAGVGPDVAALLRAFPPVVTEYFGVSPAERFVVVVFQGPFMDGGGFRQSFTLQLGTPVRPADALVWEHGLAHEMIHLWLGNQVRGAPPEDTYWFTEGFTDYLAVKLMYRAGLLDEAMLQQRLANIIRRVRLAPMLSPGIGLVEAGARKNANWARLYGGGAMVALLLDAEDAPGLQAALRDLANHGEAPYSQAALLTVLDRHTAGGATRAFALVDAGAGFGSLITLLGTRGLEVTGFSPDEVYVQFPGGCVTPSCVPSFLRR